MTPRTLGLGLCVEALDLLETVAALGAAIFVKRQSKVRLRGGDFCFYFIGRAVAPYNQNRPATMIAGC